MDEAGELRQLEESLWRADTRFDPAYMETVLAPDFAEFGQSGRTYDRAAVLDLPVQALDARLHDLTVARVTDDVRLVTYVSEVGGATANRSSLWVRTPTGWRLRFHQGTPTAPMGPDPF